MAPWVSWQNEKGRPLFIIGLPHIVKLINLIICSKGLTVYKLMY